MRPHGEEKRERPQSRRRKNRRRWCKGVEGVEHKPRWVDVRVTKDVLVFKCETCGKELDIAWPSRWRATSRAKYDRIIAENGFPRGWMSRLWNRYRE